MANQRSRGKEGERETEREGEVVSEGERLMERGMENVMGLVGGLATVEAQKMDDCTMRSWRQHTMDRL